MKKRILALLIAAVMLLSLTACGEGKKTQTDAEVTSSESVEKEAETTEKSASVPALGNFTSIDMDGNEVTSDIFKGKKVTMVNIWATFCGPCIKEMPDLEKLNKAYADKGFQVVGIVCDVFSVGDGKYDEQLLDDAEHIVEQTGVTYLNILPSESLDEAKLSDVLSVPETIFVDEDGNQIGESFIGSRDYEDWAAIIEDIL